MAASEGNYVFYFIPAGNGSDDSGDDDNMSDEKQKSVPAAPSTSSGPPPPAAASSPIKMKRQKRRRTRSTNSNSPSSPGRGFFIPGFSNLGGAEPNSKMSLSDVMDAAKGLTNMYLAHEIAVDKDFMLQDLKPKEDEQGLQAQVYMTPKDPLRHVNSHYNILISGEEDCPQGVLGSPRRAAEGGAAEL